MDKLVLLTLYRNFEQSINSEITRKQYLFFLRKYIQHIGGEDYLLRDTKLIESQIIDYILKLKNKNNSWSNLAGNLSAIYHFYAMNDILLNKKKINKFIGTKNPRKIKIKHILQSKLLNS